MLFEGDCASCITTIANTMGHGSPMKSGQAAKRLIQKEIAMVPKKEMNGTVLSHSKAKRMIRSCLERATQAVFLHHAFDRLAVHTSFTRCTPHMPIVPFEKIDQEAPLEGLHRLLLGLFE